MSVIQSIRDKGAWIVFGIIALALIAFILQDGMRRNTGRGNVNNIAVVNGDAIEKASFDEKSASLNETVSSLPTVVQNQAKAWIEARWPNQPEWLKKLKAEAGDV